MMAYLRFSINVAKIRLKQLLQVCSLATENTKLLGIKITLRLTSVY